MLLHEGFLLLVYIWKKEWPWLRRQPPRLISGLICALCAGHSVRSSKWPQIVRGSSRGAQWNQLSISHFPLFVFSVPHGPSICSDIDPSISDCPALVRTPLNVGVCSVQHKEAAPQWDNYAENERGQTILESRRRDFILTFLIGCILLTKKKKSPSAMPDTLRFALRSKRKRRFIAFCPLLREGSNI